MKRNVYIFLEFLRKGFPSKISFLEWAGEIDVGKATDFIDGIDAEKMLEREPFSAFSGIFSVVAVIRDMPTGRILYNKILYECKDLG